MAESRLVRAIVSCALAAVLVGCGGASSGGETPPAETTPEPVVEPIVEPTDETGGLAPAAFGEYSWEELAQIANLIESAGSVEEGRNVAAQYGLIEADGTITLQTRELKLPNGVVCDVRVVGILHDQRSDGSGLAGITFMTGPIDVHAMNPSMVSAGGWEACEMRSWLAQDGMALLPEELSSVIVSVDKPTNNVGVTNTAGSVTVTSDTLWLFSAREVCGDVGWFGEEFGGGFSYMDAVVNAEGEQYEAFAQAGVADDTDPNHMLALTIGGSKCPWWYRTPYPFNPNDASDPGIFYQVMASGFPSSVGQADVAVGVVVGFCM